MKRFWQNFRQAKINSKGNKSHELWRYFSLGLEEDDQVRLTTRSARLLNVIILNAAGLWKEVRPNDGRRGGWRAAAARCLQRLYWLRLRLGRQIRSLQIFQVMLQANPWKDYVFFFSTRDKHSMISNSLVNNVDASKNLLRRQWIQPLIRCLNQLLQTMKVHKLIRGDKVYHIK